MDGDYSLDAMARAIDLAVKALDLPRFVIVGHSYGGAVVATYGAEHPDKVAGVIYLDAAGGGITMTDEQKQQITAAVRADKMKIVRAWFPPMLQNSSA